MVLVYSVKVTSKDLTIRCIAYKCFTQTVYMSQDSSVGIETGYGLDDRMIGVRSPVGVGKFSLRLRVQTGSGPTQSSI
jgi:hypothetical protein